MRSIEKPSTISLSNISEYGFAVFHGTNLPELKNDYWQRDIIINVGIAPEKVACKFSVPKNLLIELSRDTKISSAPQFKISSHNLCQRIIQLLAERAGWNQTPTDLKAICELASDGTFIATYEQFGESIPLGSGVALPVNNDLCWIGMILVHPELRRQGVAQSIMFTCLEYARVIMNKAIVGLDATPLGKQVYDSLGFQDSFEIWRSVISTNSVELKSNASFEILEEAEMIDPYLEKISYVERAKVTELLSKLPGSKCAIAKSDDNIMGFILSRPGRLRPFIGPLIADTGAAASALLAHILQAWNVSGYSHVLMDIPDYHLSSSIFTKKEMGSFNSEEYIPIEPMRSFTRMYQLVESMEKISKDNFNRSDTTELLLERTIKGYEKTKAFMDKESVKVLPLMYGTSGPEWS